MRPTRPKGKAPTPPAATGPHVARQAPSHALVRVACEGPPGAGGGLDAGLVGGIARHSSHRRGPPLPLRRRPSLGGLARSSWAISCGVIWIAGSADKRWSSSKLGRCRPVHSSHACWRAIPSFRPSSAAEAMPFCRNSSPRIITRTVAMHPPTVKHFYV
jgi:hypothetical protein